MGLGFGLGFACDCAEPCWGQVKSSCSGFVGTAWLQHSQTGAEPRCARRDLVAGLGLGQLFRACTVRERQALRVESTPTSYRSSHPPARPSAPPLLRAGSPRVRPRRSAPHRPLAQGTLSTHSAAATPPPPCTGRTHVHRVWPSAAIRPVGPRRAASSARATIWPARCIKCGARGFRRH